MIQTAKDTFLEEKRKNFLRNKTKDYDHPRLIPHADTSRSKRSVKTCEKDRVLMFGSEMEGRYEI